MFLGTEGEDRAGQSRFQVPEPETRAVRLVLNEGDTRGGRKLQLEACACAGEQKLKWSARLTQPLRLLVTRPRRQQLPVFHIKHRGVLVIVLVFIQRSHFYPLSWSRDYVILPGLPNPLARPETREGAHCYCSTAGGAG